MAINWQELLVTFITTVGGGGVLLGASAYLIKTALTHRLAQEAETFKARLKADADAEIERLKTSLQMIALEHQVRFSKLHEKRAEVIAEIYKGLVELSSLVHEYARQDRDFPLPTRDNHTVFEEANAKSRDITRFWNPNKIYLPTSFNLRFIEFLRAARGNFSRRAHEYRKDRTTDEFDDGFIKAIFAAEEELEKEFRKILGETQESKAN